MNLKIIDVQLEHAKKICELSEETFGESIHDINCRLFFKWMFF